MLIYITSPHQFDLKPKGLYVTTRHEKEILPCLLKTQQFTKAHMCNAAESFELLIILYYLGMSSFVAKLLLFLAQILHSFLKVWH